MSAPPGGGGPRDALARRLESARGHEEAGRPAEALAEAWRALDLAPDDAEAKRLLAGLLRRNPKLACADRRRDLARLLADPGVNPWVVAPAGWWLMLADGQPLAARADQPAALAEWIERDEFALRLLAESHVTVIEAESALTRLRRWLLLSGRWAGFPRLIAALAAQAAHNDGAWLVDAEERRRLDADPDSPIAAAYRPPRPAAAGAAFADPVTGAVADQYRRWPYPAWSRPTAPRPKTVPGLAEQLDGGRPSPLPVEAELLVAGCGTGHEAALMAMTYPDARVTAIDISEASLAYAAERCAALGLRRIDFRLLDLHRAAELGRSFDLISCSGVLHHLPDPEAGWAALAATLKPDGIMHVMVYSRIARLRVRAAQARIAELRERPIDDDLLREARRRLIDAAPALIAGSHDFYTLSGVRDLLFHAHEDPFDVPRIVRALDRLGLELLAFKLPSPADRARYRRDHPDDPAFRDVAAWAALEKKRPFLFSGMYKFWCRKRRG